MSKLLEDLWENYYLEKSCDSDESKECLGSFIKIQEEIYSQLNDKQKGLLEEYEEIRRNLELLSEKTTFIEGVSLGCRFIIEALNNKNF